MWLNFFSVFSVMDWLYKIAEEVVSLEKVSEVSIVDKTLNEISSETGTTFSISRN